MKYGTKKKVHFWLGISLLVVMVVAIASPIIAISKIALGLIALLYGIRGLVKQSMRSHFRVSVGKKSDDDDDAYLFHWVLVSSVLITLGLAIPTFLYFNGFVAREWALRIAAAFGVVFLANTARVMIRHIREEIAERNEKAGQPKIDVSGSTTKRKKRRDFFENLPQSKKPDKGTSSGSR